MTPNGESSSIDKRGRALEDEFFHRVDQQLIDQLRKKAAEEEMRDQLAIATGISDPAVLQKILDEGVDAQSLVALSLIPLVQVAWADGKIDSKEREAVLKAVEEMEHPRGSSTYQLLEHWLRQRPSPKLMDAWREYVKALRSKLPEATYDSMSRSVLQRARDVAAAAGGILGIRSISSTEENVLSTIKSDLGITD